MADSADGTTGGSPGGGDRTSGDGASSQNGGGGMRAVINHISQDKIEAAMWLSRVVTIMFSVSFLLPVFGVSQYTSGQRVLIAGAITSALRLHQRMPHPRMNREFLQALIAEDSAHYLLYSVLMLYTTNPGSIVLMPVFLFALLHVTKYTKILLNLMGPNSLGLIRRMIEKIDMNQRVLLRFIATVEITMMPATVMMIFSGQASLILPFGYYRFLCLRYSSTRNPYCRQVFSEFRMIGEQLSRHERCPAIGTTIINKVIAFTCRMCPQQAAAAAT